MNELNELIESTFLDAGVEGIGTTAGVGLMWGMFFCGSFALFKELLALLVSTV